MKHRMLLDRDETPKFTLIYKCERCGYRYGIGKFLFRMLVITGGSEASGWYLQEGRTFDPECSADLILEKAIESLTRTVIPLLENDARRILGMPVKEI